MAAPLVSEELGRLSDNRGPYLGRRVVADRRAYALAGALAPTERARGAEHGAEVAELVAARL